MARLAFYTQTYNSGQGLHKAIKSVLNQTFTDFVYYIVDDASSDDTVKIIEKYAEKDPRIIPHYSKENKVMGHYVEYLNKIVNSDAEFLCYLDHDDYYEPDFAKTLIGHMDTHKVDMAVGASLTHNVASKKKRMRKSGIEGVLLNQHFGKHFCDIHLSLRPLWGRIYRLSVFREHSIKFRSDHERVIDIRFVHDFAKKAKSIYFDNTRLHTYLRNGQDTSILFKFNKKSLDARIGLIEYLDEWLEHFEATNTIRKNNEKMKESILFDAIFAEWVVAFKDESTPYTDKIDALIRANKNEIFIKQFEIFYKNSSIARIEKYMLPIAMLILKFTQLDVNEEHTNDIYEIFCFFCNPAVTNFSEIISQEDFVEICKQNNKDLILQLISDNFVPLVKLACTHGANQPHEIVILKAIVRQSKVKEIHKHKDSLVHYPELIGDIFNEKYYTASNTLQDIIIKVFYDNPESSFWAADTLKAVAHHTGNQNHAILANRALSVIYFERNDKEMFEKIASELEVTFPQDADIANMRASFE